MWPDRVSNPGPPTYESGALPIALRGPAIRSYSICKSNKFHFCFFAALKVKTTSKSVLAAALQTRRGNRDNLGIIQLRHISA